MVLTASHMLCIDSWYFHDVISKFNNDWAGAQHFLQDCMCSQRRQISVTGTFAGHSLGSQGSNVSSSRQRRLWSACVDVKTDLISLGVNAFKNEGKCLPVIEMWTNTGHEKNKWTQRDSYKFYSRSSAVHTSVAFITYIYIIFHQLFEAIIWFERKNWNKKKRLAFFLLTRKQRCCRHSIAIVQTYYGLSWCHFMIIWHRVTRVWTMLYAPIDICWFFR